MYRLAIRYNIAILIVNHTTKTNNQNTSKYGAHDWMYLVFGSSEWTNSARCALTIAATEDPNVFEFRMAKRSARSGWERNDKGQYVKYFKHSLDNKLTWLPADEEDI